MKKDDKTGIIYEIWNTPRPKAVFLLVHGLGAHTGRWRFLADFFARNSVSSYAIELRGFGRTESLKGHIDSFSIYFGDIRRLRDIIVGENKNKKIFLVGESVGALISFLIAAGDPDLFGGLICISPAFAGRLKATFLDYIRMLFPLLYNPRKHFNIPFKSEMCTRDADYCKQMNADIREHRLATSRFVFELLKAQMRGRMVKKEIKAPVLFLLSGNDKLVDTEASKRIFKSLKAEDKALIEYPEMYHALSIDLGREELFKDILKWVEKRI